jgi:hypothetical protein
MKSTKLACAAVAAVFVSVAAATPALALPDTYVTATGSNANNCAITTPCQTMAFGVSQTDAGGVLHCLDNNNYFNGATITQSITIDCSNTTADGGAFIINGSGISVHIRGLSMRQVGTGLCFRERRGPLRRELSHLREYQRHRVCALRRGQPFYRKQYYPK